MNDANASIHHAKAQRLILRICAIVALLALPAVVVPRMMAEKVSWAMGFGQPPMTPLMLYMMAGGAAVYVGQAVLMWVMASDVTRYQPLIRIVAWVFLVCAPLFWWIDSQAGIPRWWRAMDSVGSLLAGTALAWACYSRITPK